MTDLHSTYGTRKDCLTVAEALTALRTESPRVRVRQA